MKKRVRRWGGREVGWDVSAFRSHCITEMLGRRSGFGESDSSAKGEGRDRLAPDGTVEASGSKAKALPDVLQEQITFDIPFECGVWPIRQHIIHEMGDELTQHTGRNIDACPEVSFLIEDLARQAGATADVEQERRLVRR